MSQYNLEPDTAIERIEISNEGIFEFYLFSVSRSGSEDLSLFAMRPEQSLPIDADEPSPTSE